MSSKGGLADLCVPRTIRDAIHLTQLIGYRYLGVDALCIVQDDSSICYRQIAQMYDIYQSADVTIVAAGGRNCSAAVPGVGTDREDFQDDKIHKISGLPLMSLPASMKYGIKSSSWKTRGWTFQEELCSQRLLILRPQGAVFTCPSALCREDLCLEVSTSSPGSHDSRGSCEGLSRLSVMIRSLENASREQQIALFQGLVKQYMHRSFSRNDDIENAFAGVSRMLEPLIGPSYHGIPKAHFTEIIHGCWFWDTSLVRRKDDFPSWSWVGWVYRVEQVDGGIKAVPGQSTVLQFYACDGNDQKLGQSLLGTEALSGQHLLLSGHFVPDNEMIHAKFAALRQNSNAWTSHLIAFTTSCAALSLRPLHHANFSSPMVREYHVIHPNTGKHLTSIRLDSEFVMQAGKVHLFIVIAYDEQLDSFRLVLIIPASENHQIVERVNVTMQSRLVRADDWTSLGPEKSTFIMG